MSSLLETEDGYAEGQNGHRELDSPVGSPDGKNQGHIGGPQNKHRGREDEENMTKGVRASNRM